MHRHPRLPAVPDVWWRHQLLGWWWPWRDVHQPCEVFRPKFRTTSCCWGLWWIMQYDCVSPIQTNKKNHCYTTRHHQKIHEHTQNILTHLHLHSMFTVHCMLRCRPYAKPHLKVLDVGVDPGCHGCLDLLWGWRTQAHRRPWGQVGPECFG